MRTSRSSGITSRWRAERDERSLIHAAGPVPLRDAAGPAADAAAPPGRQPSPERLLLLCLAAGAAALRAAAARSAAGLCAHGGARAHVPARRRIRRRHSGRDARLHHRLFPPRRSCRGGGECAARRADPGRGGAPRRGDGDAAPHRTAGGPARAALLAERLGHRRRAERGLVPRGLPPLPARARPDPARPAPGGPRALPRHHGRALPAALSQPRRAHPDAARRAAPDDRPAGQGLLRPDAAGRARA